MADKHPNITLGQYKGLAVTRHVRPVLDQTVEQEIGHRCRLHARYVPTSAPAKRGDKVTLDFEGFRDGQPIPDSKMENVTVLLGTGKLMPAAEQAVYGHSAGETFQFDFTYPADFRVENLSGVTAQFTITLHSVAEKHTPAADEAFAKSRGFESMEAMRAQIRKEKEAIHEQAADRKAGQDLLDMAGANLTADLPEKQLAAEAQREYRLLEDKLKKSGIPLDAYCKSCRTTPEQLKASYRQIAEKRLRSILAAKAISEAEGIVARKDEVDAEYRRLAAQHVTSEEEIRKVLSPDAVAAALVAQKVQAFLLENAQVTTIHDKAPERPAKKED
ncbi:trigger factor [Faecalibacterium sp. An122]|uniref:trigger factor n=1 Tax=Faecalibacterium sp. An122 TaxID=1965551 RepID=UPI000B3A155C|nr:trigger factor [Faecalibacterium sp. An122]OUQ39349.1 trigger factor [Faecalibacterium sp. An122]